MKTAISLIFSVFLRNNSVSNQPTEAIGRLNYLYGRFFAFSNASITMKKRIKKKKIKFFSEITVIIPLIIAMAILSRTLPDGDLRLDVGKSRVGEKAIALTFDDGPGGCTEELLDGLKELDVQASFFVIGEKAEKHPEIVKRAYKEGHLIGNHTYSHVRLPFVGYRTAKEEINKTSEIIEEITGSRPLFFRAPYGDVSAIQLKQLDTFFISWSVSTYDWNDKDADYIYERIMKKAADGEIILLHDTKKPTVEAVLRAIPELQEQGYEFVRVDDLLTRNGDKLKMGVPYRKCEHEKGAVVF